MEIILKANPSDLETIERGFKPISVVEKDCDIFACHRLGLLLDRWHGDYRVLIVEAVDRVGANKKRTLAKLLGPASGVMSLIIPCDSETEWAQVQDLMERRSALAKGRETARRERIAAFQQRMNVGLGNIAEEMIRQKKGQSTYGYGPSHTQRST